MTVTGQGDIFPGSKVVLGTEGEVADPPEAQSAPSLGLL